MCHHLEHEEWRTALEEEREAEPTEATDDEVPDEPERREPAVPPADD